MQFPELVTDTPTPHPKNATAVTDLTAVAKSDRSISVAWNAPAGDACVDTYNYVVYEKGQPEPRSVAPQARAYTITIDNLKVRVDACGLLTLWPKPRPRSAADL